MVDQLLLKPWTQDIPQNKIGKYMQIQLLRAKLATDIYYQVVSDYTEKFPDLLSARIELNSLDIFIDFPSELSRIPTKTQMDYKYLNQKVRKQGTSREDTIIFRYLNPNNHKVNLFGEAFCTYVHRPGKSEADPLLLKEHGRDETFSGNIYHFEPIVPLETLIALRQNIRPCYFFLKETSNYRICPYPLHNRSKIKHVNASREFPLDQESSEKEEKDEFSKEEENF